ncbi:hypothetical protein KIW84_043061 [Lathyrus oleraceus]|uniref:Uncharacterized protein n=1 Tax=Pisum sativum TaxID=3888 RepID=A0A9D5ANK9_PEA|nr:hypothetical protein KIW84_043061 [Pisum sativum]
MLIKIGRLAPSDVVAVTIRKVLIKLYRGNFIRYSELKVHAKREEKDEYFDLFKEDYVNHLKQATQNDNNVDGSEKLQLWKEVVDVKSRGWCYGTARMAVNIRCGVSYLTQLTISNPNREAESQAIKTARAEASRAREEDALANARANEAKAKTTDLKRKFEEFHIQLFAWQTGQAGPSIAPSSVDHNTHGHYDDDSDEQALDLEEMSDGC